jgi:hypothetical protein
MVAITIPTTTTARLSTTYEPLSGGRSRRGVPQKLSSTLSSRRVTAVMLAAALDGLSAPAEHAA